MARKTTTIQAPNEDGLTNVLNVQDKPSCLWFRELPCGRHEEMTLEEDSGYDSNLRARAMAMAARCCDAWSDKSGKPDLTALPEFDNKNRIKVTIEIVPA